MKSHIVCRLTVKKFFFKIFKDKRPIKVQITSQTIAILINLPTLVGNVTVGAMHRNPFAYDERLIRTTVCKERKNPDIIVRFTLPTLCIAWGSRQQSKSLCWVGDENRARGRECEVC